MGMLTNEQLRTGSVDGLTSLGVKKAAAEKFMCAVSGSAAADSSTQRDGLGDLLMAVDKL